MLTAGLVACGEPEAEHSKRRGAEPTSDRAVIDRARRPALLVAHLGLSPGARVADIGAGAGYLEPYLARAVGSRGRVVATDVDPVAVATIAAVAGREQLGQVEARLVGRDHPGLEPQAYDLVLLSRVDHLLADRVAYLRELTKALAAGGRIAVCNRIDREGPLRRAVARAGLRVVASHRDLPAQFLVVLEPAGVEVL